MVYQAEACLAPLKAQLFMAGEQCSANLLEISPETALLQLHVGSASWFGMFVALSLGDLPSCPAHVRATEGNMVRIEFKPRLHPSVVAAVEQALVEA